MIMSNKTSRCFNLINTGRTIDKQQENTVPTWLLTCRCIDPAHNCNCGAKQRPDMLLILNHPHDSPPPNEPQPNLIIQFIEFTYCHDKFSPDIITQKETKYNTLLANIRHQGWNVPPLLTITAGVRGAIHSRYKKLLHEDQNLKIKISSINKTFQEIHQNAIEYLMHIILTKHKMEHHQPLPPDPP